jgi:VWFA-related protein
MMARWHSHTWVRLAPCLVATLVCLAADIAARQEPRRPYTEHVDVQRVMVDARVVDASGGPVLGLQPEDFRVTIDGKTSRVESVLWVGGRPPDDRTGEPAADDETSAQRLEMGRLIVFLFQKDLEPSRIIGLMRMLMETRGLIDTLAPEDRVAILSFDYHLKIWVDFTNDRERLRRILKHGILFERPAALVSARSGISLIGRLDQAVGRKAYSVERGLELIGRALQPLPGSKSVVLVGHGFGRYTTSGVVMEREYAPARRALVAARATVFSLDVTNADYHSLEAGLEIVSEQTGGFFARTHIFPGRAMRQLAGALAGYYVLFVERPDVPHGTHDIAVDLVNRKGTVLARSAFEG